MGITNTMVYTMEIVTYRKNIQVAPVKSHCRVVNHEQEHFYLNHKECFKVNIKISEVHYILQIMELQGLQLHSPISQIITSTVPSTLK